MHGPPSPTDDDAAAATSLDLRQLVLAIDRAWPQWEARTHAGVPAPWGFLVAVESATGQLVHRPLDEHPARFLAGWAAPEHWCVVGVAVCGSARRGDDPTTGPDARVVWVCHRDGRSASLLALPGEQPAVTISHAHGHPPDEGRVPLLLRSALARPPSHPPPPA